MSEIRKHKGIIVCFLILTILVFAKQSSFVGFSSAGIKNENTVKKCTHNHISSIVFTKNTKQASSTNLLKKVCIETIIKSTNQSTSLLTSYFIFKCHNLSINASILKLNCILRI